MSSTIKVNCPHCNQTYHVPTEQLGSQAQCEKCNNVFTIQLPPKTSPKSNNLLLVLTIVSLATALASLTFTGYVTYKIRHIAFPISKTGKTPEEATENAFKKQLQILASADATSPATYLLNKHLKEITRTFSIDSCSKKGNLAVVYYSFSIGKNVVRDTETCVKIDEDTWMETYVSEYSLDAKWAEPHTVEELRNWLKLEQKNIENWKKSSASIFDLTDTKP